MDLKQFNTAPADDVRPDLLACCHVPRWADTVLAGRPYADEAAVVRAADEAGRFTPGEVDRALEAHPRIGERVQGDHADVTTDADTARALGEGNRAYEERFDRVFLICASGLTAAEILENLRSRLDNDPQTEVAVVADELRRIALLRLERVLSTGGVAA
jgi:2-oxo-4-hydroxy-4-carboxy-5-ureidoimidazoline decarboxylase